MMKIYLAADHRGFFWKEKLASWLKNDGYSVEDLGNDVFDPEDDYPDFAQKVAQKLADSPNDRGIVLCGSGIGVDIVANRVAGVRCGLALNKDQIIHGRQIDNINCLALAADFLSFYQAKKIVKAFLTTDFANLKKSQRRLKKIKQ